MNELTVRLFPWSTDGYYFTHDTPVQERYEAEALMEKISWILENNLDYTTRIFDKDKHVPPNEWKGQETQTLLGIARHLNKQIISMKVASLFENIEQLAADKIRGFIPIEVVKARELGYLGYNRIEATRFVQTFNINIESFISEAVTSDVVNAKTVVYEGISWNINILETTKRVKSKLDSQPQLKELIKENLKYWHIPCRYYARWAQVHFLILTGIIPRNEDVLTWVSDYCDKGWIRPAEYLLRYYHKPDLTNSSSNFDLNLLYKALRAGSPAAIQNLRDYDPDFENVYTKNTLLGEAYIVHARNIAEYMIARTDLSNDYPIITAIRCGFSEAFIQYMIDRGANFDEIKVSVIAMAQGRYDLVELLIKNGAHVHPISLLRLDQEEPDGYQRILPYISKEKLP